MIKIEAGQVVDLVCAEDKVLSVEVFNSFNDYKNGPLSLFGHVFSGQPEDFPMWEVLVEQLNRDEFNEAVDFEGQSVDQQNVADEMFELVNHYVGTEMVVIGYGVEYDVSWLICDKETWAKIRQEGQKQHEKAEDE